MKQFRVISHQTAKLVGTALQWFGINVIVDAKLQFRILIYTDLFIFKNEFLITMYFQQGINSHPNVLLELYDV